MRERMSGKSIVKLPATLLLAAVAAALLLFFGGFSYYGAISPSSIESTDRERNESHRPMNGPDILASAPVLHCAPQPPSPSNPGATPPSSDELRSAVLHYATSPIVPQQSLSEIRISFEVLIRKSPCNFLVFGLGHDSPMWSAFNFGGTTLFLEEDRSWFESVLRTSPFLRAHHVEYPTKLSQADTLMKSYRAEPACLPSATSLRGNRLCRLALADLPDEVYEREWDLLMIDAPKGYFAEAPGRMGAIYSAAVMARARKGEGFTHVFLHDVNRAVEKAFALEFLCKKYLVEGAGRLWHFRIPPANPNDSSRGFC